MVEMSNRILFPSALFRFTDNSVTVQLIQMDEAGNSGVIAENSFPKIKDAVEYYMEVLQIRKEKYISSTKAPKEAKEVDVDDEPEEADFGE
jgi:hypothetical protein